MRLLTLSLLLCLATARGWSIDDYQKEGWDKDQECDPKDPEVGRSVASVPLSYALSFSGLQEQPFESQTTAMLYKPGPQAWSSRTGGMQASSPRG